MSATFSSVDIFRLILLSLLVVCALCAVLSRKLMTTVVVYMSYSAVMSVVWILLRAPDLAITEAAVGAGVSSILFFLCLRRIGKEKRTSSAEPDTSPSAGSPASPAPSADPAPSLTDNPAGEKGDSSSPETR